MVHPRSRKQKCLVTGGAGFLGRHLVDALTEGYDVSIFDVHESGQPSVKAIVGDIRKLKDVEEACKGMDVVFHCASVAPTAEGAANRELAQAVNVSGTANVVAACRAAGVPHLVFTSSASVIFDGRPLNNADESAPYASRPLDYYTETKVSGSASRGKVPDRMQIEAEKIVLAANGEGGLATVALRPSGIFGEWDRLMVPTLVAKAKQGKMRFIIGDGKNLMEFTYAGNVADAHVLAAEKLGSQPEAVGGRAYFVTNDDPVPFWSFTGDILEGLGYQRPSLRLPWLPLLLLAMFVQTVLRPLFRLKQSDFSPSRIRMACTNRQLSCGRAKRELGYRPRVSLRDGLQRTVAHFQALASGRDYKKVR